MLYESKKFAKVKFAEKVKKKDADKIYRHLQKTRTLPEEKYLQQIAASNL